MLGFGAKKTGGAHDEENIDDLSPQLNEALREEIVEYLKFGFDALFNTEFEKTRDPLKDQITIFIDPSEALRDDETETQPERGNSVSSQMSSWFSHHSAEDESRAAKRNREQKMVYRDSAYLPPATPDVPHSSSTSTTNMELNDVVVLVKDEDEDGGERSELDTKLQNEMTPALSSPSMLRRHLSAVGDDAHVEDVVITAGNHKLNSTSHVVFQEKLTSVFHDFRKKLGIEKTFRSEMRQISAGMETNGRSGSFFFFTQRKLFCLKTMSKKEFEVLTRLVKPSASSGVVPYTEYVLR